ncbi:lipocalin-like domain-containing protein [Photobacterium sp. 1_MG-2023]|uniref:lipocalin-like domain-containing protein n=1 Tax=Photobacterium sp. 1_MG-2023 TaxID=3062646 RepID=UPI0026E4802A|nr:lipocalin-like domain-containing protein [Photobacterium sp. 1_MG-2023]MDO6705421.1 lipocalin-like domain-containing protein [Photobacterium sp. 1_MG-2023]
MDGRIRTQLKYNRIGLDLSRVWLFWGVLLAGCGPQQTPDSAMNLLTQGTDPGFERVVPDRTFRFPADHLSHPNFRTEWWYLTANLATEQGEWLAVQWTLFRNASRPVSLVNPESGWQSPQRYMAHVVVTKADQRYQAERFARGGIGQAGVQGQPFTLWLDNWRWQAEGSAPFPAQLSFQDQDMAVRLDMHNRGSIVLQGQQGYSQKDPADPALASYYYSMPFVRLRGDIVLAGQRYQVSGNGWFDREWSSQPLSAHQQGWDWFSIHLDDGRALMLYQLRSQLHPAHVFGSLSQPDGQTEIISPQEASLTPIQTADIAGRDFPVRWRIQIPSQHMALEVQAKRTDQLLPFIFPYWEGPVAVSGSHTGQGFMELTGY